jgi:hypothetical protein
MRTANPLRCRVYNNVHAVIDGAAEVTSSPKGVIDNDWYASLVGNCDYLLEIGDVILRITNALKLKWTSVNIRLRTYQRTHIDRLRLLVNSGLEIVGAIPIDKFGLDAETWEENLELVVCATVEI